MRKLAIALLLPAALALTGAAPAGAIEEMVECRLSYADMRAAAATVPLAGQDDESVAPDRKIYSFFGGPMPKPYGFAANSFGSTDMLDSGGERYMIIATVAAPFDQVRAAILDAHGPDVCPLDPGRNRCMGRIRSDGEWMVAAVIAEYPGYVSIGCGYQRPRH